MNARTEQAILEKLKELPPERLAEVEDFADFLRGREKERVRSEAAQEKQTQPVSSELSMSAFGMWAERDELADVQAYLRNLRAPRYTSPQAASCPVLVDQDVLIWYLRGNQNAARALNDLPEFAVSAVSCMELVQGCRNKQELERLKRDFGARQVRIVPITEPISSRAIALLEAHFLGDGLQMADALIAASVLQLHSVLITANTKHFEPIDRLPLQPRTP